jgi:hypothetical protein
MRASCASTIRAARRSACSVADNADALRGLYLDGIVLDERADMDPRVWPEVIRPALADRAGWAVFIGTPKGRNAFFETWRHAERDPAWFALMLKAGETGLIPAKELAAARCDLSEEQYAQEFECSFDAAVIGAYYGRLMNQAKEQRRIAHVPHEASAPVWTAWDLGIADATAIWFAQAVGREIRIIDYYESSGVGLAHYVRELQKRDYLYAGHIVPHDAQAKELGTGKSRIELMQSLGLRNVTLAPTHFVEDGIEAVRVFLPKCWFDVQKCPRGIDALSLYRAEYDEKRAMLKPRPLHDWCSHAADAFRYLAMALDRAVALKGFHRRIVYPPSGVVRGTQNPTVRYFPARKRASMRCAKCPPRTPLTKGGSFTRFRVRRSSATWSDTGVGEAHDQKEIGLFGNRSQEGRISHPGDPIPREGASSEPL